MKKYMDVCKYVIYHSCKVLEKLENAWMFELDFGKGVRTLQFLIYAKEKFHGTLSRTAELVKMTTRKKIIHDM